MSNHLNYIKLSYMDQSWLVNVVERLFLLGKISSSSLLNEENLHCDLDQSGSIELLDTSVTNWKLSYMYMAGKLLLMPLAWLIIYNCMSNNHWNIDRWLTSLEALVWTSMERSICKLGFRTRTWQTNLLDPSHFGPYVRTWPSPNTRYRWNKW